MENNEHIHAVMWAARRSGLYYVPINTHLTAAEAAYIVDNSGAKAIIGSAALRATCAGLAEHLPGGLPGLLMIAGPFRGATSTAGSATRNALRTNRIPHRRRARGRPAAVLVGHHRPAQGDQTRTAARPARRGARHDVGAGRLLDDPESVYLSPAPLYHTAPSVWSMSAQAGGITTVVMEKFDPEGALDAIQHYRVTHGQFVPAMFTRMLKLPQAVRDSYDLSSLQRVMHAAAPCPVEIKKQMIDWWGRSSTSTTRPPRRSDRR